MRSKRLEGLTECGSCRGTEFPCLPWCIFGVVGLVLGFRKATVSITRQSFHARPAVRRALVTIANKGCQSRDDRFSARSAAELEVWDLLTTNALLGTRGTTYTVAEGYYLAL